MSERPNDSLHTMAWAIASILAGGGIIALLVHFFGIDLLISLALFVIIPVACLALAVGLISFGTLTAIFSGGLTDRIKLYTEQMRADKEAAPA